jgi:hypothetical protein
MGEKMIDKRIWSFVHEPKTIDEYIAVPEIKERLIKVIADVPNTMLFGRHGIGKGTFMNILLKSTGYDFIRINGSLESSVDAIRDKVQTFAMSKGTTRYKIVYYNECLQEDEHIRTLSGPKRLGDCKVGDILNDIISFNVETMQLEIDTGEIISDSMKEVYEIELENGKKIQCSSEHPILVCVDGKLVYKKASDIIQEDEIFLYEV